MGMVGRGAKTPKPAAGFTDPAFARIGDLAHLFAGLVFPPNRQPSAEAGMRRAMSVLRIGDPGGLLRAFESPGHARDAVLAELTVGESYFFRDAAQLELLATEILPARIAQYGPSRPLRLWSAGCASGEEPFTLAIALREQRWPHPARILGTDIARPRLAAARRGRYTRWALRGVSDERIGKWFNRNGTYYDLDPAVRDAVDYRPLNLVLDDYVAAESGDGYDLVLCRNVMIYFDLPTVARIATGLLASLAPDGWLLLGASDPPLAHLVPCEVVMTPAGIAYRRADRVADARSRPERSEGPARWSRNDEGPARWSPNDIEPVWDPESIPVPELFVAPAPNPLAPTPEPRLQVARAGHDDDRRPAAGPDEASEMARAYARADYPAAEALAVAALSTAVAEADVLPTWIVYIRAIANQGRLDEAGQLCARALELLPMAPELHYLHATLLAEAGWYADAASASRRAIYLERRFVMGHLLLGDALTRIGDTAGARIAFANVIHLLADAGADTVIAAADGVPASRLRQIATLRLRGAGTEVPQ